MNLVLVFADSEVAGADVGPHGLRLRLAAACVQRRDDAGAGRPEPGYAQAVELLLVGAVPAAPAAALIGRIAHGRVQAGDGRWRSQLPLPGSLAGPLRVELAFANRSELIVSAQALHCRFDGAANFSASLAC